MLTQFYAGKGSEAGNMDGSNKHRINIMKTNQPFSWRKNTPNERAAMQNERRKRKRKARAANKEDKRRKALLALEDERAMTLAKNERLLHLARKYYAKWVMPYIFVNR